MLTVAGLDPASISGVSADSRSIRPGMLYAALPGRTFDGRDFIADAVGRGAAAVLAPEGTAWPAQVRPVPLVTVAEPRRSLALLAAQPELLLVVLAYGYLASAFVGMALSRFRRRQPEPVTEEDGSHAPNTRAL